MEKSRAVPVLVNEEDRDLLGCVWYSLPVPINYFHRPKRLGAPIGYLHRVIAERAFGPLGDFRVDHINGDKQDNRRENLRLVTQKENCRNHAGHKRNKSGATGVHFDRSRGRWMAHLSQKFLGRFDTKEEALAARLKAEKELWGIQPRRAEAHGGTAPEVLSVARSAPWDGIPSHNTSGVPGVHWHKRDKRWGAYIQRNGKRRELGYYLTKEEAVAARTAAELELTAA